jgi:prepilin-type N-terminal cleavage/methylation domain-containing protein
MIREFRIQKLEDQSGFTLIEMLVVVIILGILAMIIVPQITVSTEDARLNSLQTNLNTVRSAIEVYAAQHGNNYPGAKKTDGTGTDTVAGDLPTALLDQLTLYTDAKGQTSTTLDRTNFPFGPYLKTGMPTNPYNDLGTVTCDVATTDITTKDSTGAGTGWKFYVKTGVFMAADGAHDSL